MDNSLEFQLRSYLSELESAAAGTVADASGAAEGIGSIIASVHDDTDVDTLGESGTCCLVTLSLLY